MLQVLTFMDSGDDVYLGGVVVASLLNAAEFEEDYPVTMRTIIDMFNDIHGGFAYKVNDTKSWGRARVIEYLESLYSLRLGARA